MKYILFYSILLILVGKTHSQIDNNLRKIDSIKANLVNSKLTDSISIAKNHYNIGELYRKSFLSDSAYSYFQKAEKVFKRNDLKLYLARTLYGIGVCQTNDKDYTGSEVTSIEALTLLEQLNESNNVNKYKSFIYNNLGIVFNELGQFEESVKYYNESLKLKENLKGNFDRSIGLTKNNLAFAYKNSGQYALAIKRYETILANKRLIDNHPDIHVLALGNYANTLYLSQQTDKLPGLYLKALRICDSINDSYNTIIIHQHLGEYYNNLGKKDSAKYYAYKAKNISETYNNDDLLKSLLLLSKIEKGNIAAGYLRDYVRLSDSLQKSERAKRDKFARIRFDTKQIEQENIRIARERLWLLIISITIIITSFLIYLVVNQRNKNKELKFVQQQQETNEEIYNLMLSQQDNIEEARTLEKKRISEEGPLSTHAFDTKVKGKKEMWERPPHKLALDYMWYSGELATSHREGFKKFYDLTSNVIPEPLRNKEHSSEEQVNWLCSEALHRLTLATVKDIHKFWDATDQKEVRDWVEQSNNNLLKVSWQNANGRWLDAYTNNDI